ncbi:MAG: type II toxin-antitoxin system VapC family toxin [Bryobacterales bacterium]|nr:type II toxin-antitoxin system VapC family toxin [Bryobacterales bacterium]
MSRIVLDTSAYVQFAAGHPEAVSAVMSATWVGVPTVLLGELHLGFALGTKRSANESFLQNFLGNPAVEVLPVTDDSARVYGEIVADLRRSGRPIPVNDAWIAAVAVQHGATLLTFDRHFLSVETLRTLWVPLGT